MSRRRRLLSTAVCSAPFALIVACNLISGLDKDYALDDGTAATEPTTDSSTSTSDQQTTNNTNNDSAVVVPPNDASSEKDVVIPPGTLNCNIPNVKLCTGFEGANPLDDVWTHPNAGSTISVVTETDGNHAFRAKAKGTPGFLDIALLKHTFQGGSANWGSGQTLAATFKFKIVTVGGVGYIGLAYFMLNGTEHGLALYNDGQQCDKSAPPCVDDNDPRNNSRPHNHDNSLKVDLNKWYAAKVTLTQNADKTYGDTVEVDGKLLDSRLTGGIVGTPAIPAEFDLQIGAFNAGPQDTNDMEIWFDDVIVTLPTP